MVGNIFGTSILRYASGVMALIHTYNLVVVLGPYAQHCPCEALLQIWCPKTKSKTKGDTAYLFPPFASSRKKQVIKKRESKSDEKSSQVMAI